MPIRPNREEDLARPRSRKGGDVKPVIRGTMRPVGDFRAPKDWHPIAKRMWDALKTSGQADFYQNSDWALAYSLCDDLSHYKKPFKTKDGVEYDKRSGQMLQTIYQGFERLLVAEGDRLRLRLELHAPEVETEDAEVTAINEYKAGLGLVPPLTD